MAKDKASEEEEMKCRDISTMSLLRKVWSHGPIDGINLFPIGIPRNLVAAKLKNLVFKGWIYPDSSGYRSYVKYTITSNGINRYMALSLDDEKRRMP